jgi:hypothetical protein
MFAIAAIMISIAAKQVGGISVSELSGIEVDLLERLDFRLWRSPAVIWDLLQRLLQGSLHLSCCCCLHHPPAGRTGAGTIPKVDSKQDMVSSEMGTAQHEGSSTLVAGGVQADQAQEQSPEALKLHGTLGTHEKDRRLMKRRSSSLTVTFAADTPGKQPQAMDTSAGEHTDSEMAVAEGGVSSEERSVRPRHGMYVHGVDACSDPGSSQAADDGREDQGSMACA